MKGIISGAGNAGAAIDPEVRYIEGPQGPQGPAGPQGEPGSDGTGVVSFTQISGTHAPGSYDKYRLTLTDGTAFDMEVYNGADGQGTGDMTKAVYDPTGGKAQVAFRRDTYTKAEVNAKFRALRSVIIGMEFIDLTDPQSTGITILFPTADSIISWWVKSADTGEVMYLDAKLTYPDDGGQELTLSMAGHYDSEETHMLEVWYVYQD